MFLFAFSCDLQEHAFESHFQIVSTHLSNYLSSEIYLMCTHAKLWMNTSSHPPFLVSTSIL